MSGTSTFAPPQCLFLCRGPYCHVNGSEEVRNRLRDCVRSRGLTSVYLFPYACFGRCERGPNLVIYPQDVWYEGIHENDVEAIVDHLAGGPPVERLLAEVDEECRRSTRANIEEVIPNLLPQHQAKPPRRWRFWR